MPGWWARLIGRTPARSAAPPRRRAYDAAAQGRRTSSWRAGGASANAEIGAAAKLVRERSRDLARNNPYAARVVSSLVAHLVGTGIVARPQTGSDRWDRLVGELWWQWTQQCDPSGQCDFAGLQRLAVRSAVESGEVLLRRRPRRLEDGLVVPLQIQVLEADHLDATRSEERRGEGGAIVGRVVQGVEFDALDRRVAYWLLSVHPGESGGAFAPSQESRPVSAADVSHVYEIQRPGQVRGMPWLAPVVLPLRDLADYSEALILRAGAEACVLAFVTSPQADADGLPGTVPAGDAEREGGVRLTELAPMTVSYLEPGEDVEFVTPSSHAGHAEFMRAKLREIATGARVPYEILAGDLSQVNFTSARMGMIEFRRLCGALQQGLVVRQICEPALRWFSAAARGAGLVPLDLEVWAEWTRPAWESVQPREDLEALRAELRLGLKALPTAIAERGGDPDVVLAEIAATAARLDEAGLVLDCDPRRTTGSGGPRSGDGAASESAAASAGSEPDASESEAARGSASSAA